MDYMNGLYIYMDYMNELYLQCSDVLYINCYSHSGRENDHITQIF